MSFAKSKNEFSKKDMNFFSEFSSGASQQISSVFPIFLLFTVLILGITLIVWIVCGVKSMKAQDKIDKIRAEMNSPEYQERLSRKDKSQVEVEDLREYHYVVSSLDTKVADKSSSSVNTLVQCKDALPNDAYLTKYHDEDGIVEITGQTLFRESAYNYGKKLDETGLFSFVKDVITIEDPIETGYDKSSLMFANVQYQFTYTCTLKGHFTVTHASFINGTTPTPLTPVYSESKKAGEEYNIEKVNTIVVDGVTYNLDTVKIDGTAVDAADFNIIKSNDCVSGRVASNVNIELMYVAAEEDSNGGES